MSTETRTAQYMTAGEATVTEARDDFARLVRDAEYGRATYAITRHGRTVARLVGPDTGGPSPAVWGAARADFNAAMVDPKGQYRRAILALGNLLRAHYHPDREPAVRSCVHCGEAIAATVSGSSWVDGGGWDHCDGTSTSHQPTEET
jgi:prevent-host-death family protein